MEGVEGAEGEEGWGGRGGRGKGGDEGEGIPWLSGDLGAVDENEDEGCWELSMSVVNFDGVVKLDRQRLVTRYVFYSGRE